MTIGEPGSGAPLEAGQITIGTASDDGSVIYMQTHMPGWTGTPLGRRLAEWGGRSEKVPPELVLAVAVRESAGDPGAVSPRGARGLM